MSDIAAFRAELETTAPGIPIEDNPILVKQKSRDFYWYSPILKKQLENVTADLVVSPRSEDEVVTVVRLAFKHGVPVTTRGGGTGNYGQAMPLSGGVVLSLLELNRIEEIGDGFVVAEAGVIVKTLLDATRADSRQELRFWPSTAPTSTIGGFIAGGSGGVGSIAWGGLRDMGSIIALRIVTCEENPRVLTLEGEDIHKVAHAYGTTGIITEVTMPLSHACAWVDVIISFDDVIAAARFAERVSTMNGIEKKELAVVAAPMPYNYFLRHRKFLAASDSVVIAMIAPHAMSSFIRVIERLGGRLAFRSDTASAEDLKGLPLGYELCWNHTTLRALHIDSAITYLQILFPAPDPIAVVERMKTLLGDEVAVHLEFTRLDGGIACNGLHLVHYTTDERLEEIMRLFEDNGCVIFNAHRYTLEEGGMKQTDELQLAFKREADPKGLLNPGKMIAFDDPDYDIGDHKMFLFPGLVAI